MQPHNFFSTAATPSLSLHDALPILPSVPPASTQEVSESENRPATRGTAHSEVQGDERGNERGNERGKEARREAGTRRRNGATHCRPPTGPSRSAPRGYASKLSTLH